MEAPSGPRFSASVISLRTDVERIKNELWGNGRPGLADRLTKLEAAFQRLEDAFKGLKEAIERRQPIVRKPMSIKKLLALIAAGVVSLGGLLKGAYEIYNVLKLFHH
jgi:hypothetical protein